MWFWLLAVAITLLVGLALSFWFSRYRGSPLLDERLAAKASGEAERRKYPY